jgi:two-component system sensor histidine kinase UhpB
MNTIRILMLEDSALDVSIILKTLSNLSLPFECTVVNSEKDYTEKLEQFDFDIILSDYQLPAFDAAKALQLRNKTKSSIPFILITGAVSEDVAISMIKEGANDYILKDRLQRLPLSIEKAIKKQQLSLDKESIEASLSELTQRFQLAAKTSFDVMWDFDIEKNKVYCSPAIEKIIGTTVHENFDPLFLARFIHPDDLAAIERSFIHVIKSNELRWRKIFRMVRENGSVAWVNSNAMIIRNKNENAVRIIGVMHDVTEVRRLQHELIEQEVQNQKQINQITIEAQEKERMEIGKELHDNVNQLLATAKIMIDTAKNQPDMHDICLTKSQEAIMDAINELRSLAHSMMPPPFDHNEFENIVRDLAFKVNLTGSINLQLSLPAEEDLQSMSNNIKLTFYRIIQEQISNILKHAKAKNVSIEMNAGHPLYSMSIMDDGIGFDTDKNTNGIGLKNMESRCSMFGGTMDLITTPGNGCILKVSIPRQIALHA